MRAGPIVAILFLTAALGFHQACAPSHHTLNAEVQASAQATYRADADLVWSTKMTPAKFNALGKVERWQDSLQKSLLLLPPLKAGGALDMDRAPTRLQTSTSFVRFADSQMLAPATGDFAEFISEEYFLMMVVKDLVVPADGDKVLRLFELYPTDGSPTGHLVVDVRAEGDDFVFDLLAWFQTTYAIQRIRLAKSAATGPLVLAMNFPRIPENLEFSLSGKRPSEATIRQGSPPYMGKVGRQFVVHAISYGARGSFSFAEALLWKKSLDRAAQDEKVSSAMAYWAGDRDLEQPEEPENPVEPTKPLVYADLAAPLASCTACHGTKLASRANLVSSTLVDPDSGTSLWVIPGNADASPLLQAVEHRSGVSPMPKNGGKLSANQIELIKRWIQEGAK